MPVGHLTLVNAGGPESFPAVTMPDGSVRTANGFGEYGIPEDYVGTAFDPSQLYHSPRAVELEFRSSYFHCKQHDNKSYRWDGTPLGSAQNIRTTQPMLGGNQPSMYVPLSNRRPAAPYRLGRKMVSAFTGMLFGEGRWPQMRSKDPDTQAAAEQLVKSCDLALRFVHGRNLGGSSGTAGFSWYFADGVPRVKVHRGSRIHVVSWVDEDAKIPAHIIELKQTTKIGVDSKDGKIKPLNYWQRSDWTLVADVVFKPALIESDQPLVWAIDEDRTRLHNDEECHFVWVSNLPSEDDTEDGACDYGETYEQQDQLDELNTVHVVGTKLNLDPTLVLKLSADDRQGTGVIKKGTENAIVTDEKGDAKYLQLTDTQLGKEVVQEQRSQILEVNECVVLDPDKAAAAAASGEAQKIVYAPMLARCDVLRMQWGPAIERIVNQMLRSWRRLCATPVMVAVEPDPDAEVEVGTDAAGAAGTEDGEPEVFEEATQDLMLPVRTMRKPKPDGSGEEEYDVPHTPGTGDVSIEWGPYFKPNGAEKQAVVGSVGQAVGGKPVMSQRAGVELVSNLYDRDANDEWKAIQAEAAAKADQEGAMFGGTGGEVDDLPANDSPDAAGAALVELAPTDKIKTMTVNEVRSKAMGLGPLLLPDGSPDPDGKMPFVAYMAKLEAQGAAEGEAEGQANAGVVADDALPVAPPKMLPGMSE